VIYANILKNIQESISNVPACIGACNLKDIVFVSLLPQFSEWLKQFLLSVDNVCLHHRNWVEIIPNLVQGVDNVNAIAEKFFVLKWGKNKSEARTFQSSDIMVYLELPLKKYHKILEHIENPETLSLVCAASFVLVCQS
jgi:hypothetical protein